MKKTALMITVFLLNCNACLANQKKDSSNDPFPRKAVSFSRIEISESYPLVKIQCDMSSDLLKELIHSSEHIKTKPNRYIFTTWKMDLNEIYCQFLKTE